MSAPATIQDIIKAQLLRNLYFSDANSDPARPVPFVLADDGDIANAIEKTTAVLGGGLAITILIPFGKNPAPESKAVIPELLVEITAAENVLVNRSASGFGKKAYEAIRKIAAPFKPTHQGGLHFWSPGAPFSRFEFQEFGEFAAKNSANQTLLVYSALFKVTEAIS